MELDTMGAGRGCRASRAPTAGALGRRGAGGVMPMSVRGLQSAAPPPASGGSATAQMLARLLPLALDRLGSPTRLPAWCMHWDATAHADMPFMLAP